MRHSKLWRLVLAVIVAVGGGAAGGTILAGHLQGTIAVDVSPPLQLGQPVIQLLPVGRISFSSLSIERTAFKVTANVTPGDSFLIRLPVVNSATVNITALLNLSYSDGVVLSITGSGVINDVVASSYHTWKFTADAGAHGDNVAPFDRVNIEVDVLPSFVEPSVEISGSIESTSGLDGPYLVYAFSPTKDVLYLHNNPSPPTLDTNSQANLPMDMFPGTAATLYNYDQDRDSSPGRVILHGGSGAAETDLAKYQNWQMTLSQNLSISGKVTAVLWSATKNIDQTARGVVTAYLRDLSGDTAAVIASGTLDLNPWQQGSSTWVERKITIPTSNYTVPAGHVLELKVIAGGASSDMWFAYDTSLYPSQLMLKSKPIANFSATFVSAGGSKVTVAFTDTSTSDQGIVSWLWSFGDGGTSTQQNPTYEYATVGSYPVYLTVTEADADSNTQKKIAVVTLSSVTLSNTTPTAAFSATPVSGAAPLKVAFTDLSTSGATIVSWLWDFGDNTTSTQRNPTHIYPSPGTYTVSLTVRQGDTGSSTLTKTAFITVT